MMAPARHIPENTPARRWFLDNYHFSVHFLRLAGLITFGLESKCEHKTWDATHKFPRMEHCEDPSFYLHLLVKPSHWSWGFEHMYEGVYSFGTGPLFLYVWG